MRTINDVIRILKFNKSRKSSFKNFNFNLVKIFIIPKYIESLVSLQFDELTSDKSHLKCRNGKISLVFQEYC